MGFLLNKKQKIPASIVKKCLKRIFGIPIPCKGWADLAKAFPNEDFSKPGSHKIFLRKYVWTHCHHIVMNHQNPFRLYKYETKKSDKSS